MLYQRLVSGQIGPVKLGSFTLKITMPRLVWIVAITFAMFTAATTTAHSKTLSKKELLATQIGCFKYWGETKGSDCYYRNGTVKTNDQKYGKSSGTWKITGKKMCVTRKKTGNKRCFSVRRAGNGIFTDNDGYFWKPLK
ncbi:MAG: hypothetical protein AAF393_16825 [Pseudomonadota bacterium]